MPTPLRAKLLGFWVKISVEFLGLFTKVGGLIPVSWSSSKWFGLETLSKLVKLILYLTIGLSVGLIYTKIRSLDLKKIKNEYNYVNKPAVKIIKRNFQLKNVVSNWN